MSGSSGIRLLDDKSSHKELVSRTRKQHVAQSGLKPGRDRPRNLRLQSGF